MTLKTQLHGVVTITAENYRAVSQDNVTTKLGLNMRYWEFYKNHGGMWCYIGYRVMDKDISFERMIAVAKSLSAIS